MEEWKTRFKVNKIKTRKCWGICLILYNSLHLAISYLVTGTQTYDISTSVYLIRLERLYDPLTIRYT